METRKETSEFEKEFIVLQSVKNKEIITAWNNRLAILKATKDPLKSLEEKVLVLEQIIAFFQKNSVLDVADIHFELVFNTEEFKAYSQLTNKNQKLNHLQDKLTHWKKIKAWKKRAESLKKDRKSPQFLKEKIIVIKNLMDFLKQNLEMADSCFQLILNQEEEGGEDDYFKNQNKKLKYLQDELIESQIKRIKLQMTQAQDSNNFLSKKCQLLQKAKASLLEVKQLTDLDIKTKNEITSLLTKLELQLESLLISNYLSNLRFVIDHEKSNINSKANLVTNLIDHCIACGQLTTANDLYQEYTQSLPPNSLQLAKDHIDHAKKQQMGAGFDSLPDKPQDAQWFRYQSELQQFPQTVPEEKLYTFLRKIWSYCKERFGQPPCQFELILLLELIDEKSIFFNIKYGIVVENNNTNDDKENYFSHINTLFQWMILNLNGMERLKFRLDEESHPPSFLDMDKQKNRFINIFEELLRIFNSNGDIAKKQAADFNETLHQKNEKQKKEIWFNAAEQGKREELEKLLIEGENINCFNNTKETALAVVMESKKIQKEKKINTIEFLIEKGADIEYLNPEQLILLDSFLLQSKSKESLKTTEDKLTSPGFQTKNNLSAKLASKINEPTSANKPQISLEEIIQSSRQPQQSPPPVGNTPKIFNSTHTFLPPSKSPEKSFPPQHALINAVKKALDTGNLDEIETLIKKKVNVNYLDNEGNTALLTAVKFPEKNPRTVFKIVETLLNAGAAGAGAGEGGIHHLDNNNQSVLEYAEQNNYKTAHEKLEPYANVIPKNMPKNF